MITVAAARKLEEMQIEKIQVRSPMTCEAYLGICRRCYGMDLATGQLVEPGDGRRDRRRASRSASRAPSSTMRTFHIGGVATRGVEEKDHKAKHDGRVKYVGINLVVNDEGKKIALWRQRRDPDPRPQEPRDREVRRPRRHPR